MVAVCLLQGQEQANRTFRIRTIAFYNLENLFDTVNDSLVYDEERTPEGRDRWTEKRYALKIERLARVLSETGRPIAPAAPDLIGLCEAENRKVLEDLIRHPWLRTTAYGIVHFDSPDERGIDVALLYKMSAFSPTSFKSHRLLLTEEEKGEGNRDYTRDQLVVGGILDGEQLYVIVNHWPSRSGGQARSEPHRLEAARLNRQIIDSINSMDVNPKIISMGDLNDNPTDASLKRILKTEAVPDSVRQGSLFNPMERLYRKGAGSLAYRDSWSLFDQILLSASLVHASDQGYRYWQAGIFNPPYLITKHGPFRGYPYRTYSGGRYTGGYSDHFPVYVYLIREGP